MKSLLSILFFSVCFCAAVATAQETRKENAIHIVVAVYANSDQTSSKNRVFVVGMTVFRTFAELKKFVAGFASYPNLDTHVYTSGNCVVPAANPTSDEIDELTAVCAKAGIKYTHRPAG